MQKLGPYPSDVVELARKVCPDLPGMRAILIEPSHERIYETDVPEFMAAIRRRFGGAKLVHIGAMPSGDGFHVVDTDVGGSSFWLGGGGPFHGLGLILGKRGHLGKFKGATTDVVALASIVTFWCRRRNLFEYFMQTTRD